MFSRMQQARVEKESADLERNPIENALVSRVGMLNFHFCLHGLEGAYEGGFYHGLLELHENYPFRAPKLYFYTPSGRFETNTPICTSFTNYHQETWTSAWTVRTLIIATISFMYTEEPSFGCRNDSLAHRRALARKSRQFNLRNPQFVELFGHKLVRSGEDMVELKDLEDQQDGGQSDELIHRNNLGGHILDDEGGIDGPQIQIAQKKVILLLLLLLLIVIVLALA